MTDTTPEPVACTSTYTDVYDDTYTCTRTDLHSGTQRLADAHHAPGLHTGSTVCWFNEAEGATPSATELGTTAGGSNESPGSVGTSPVEQVRARVAAHIDRLLDHRADEAATVDAITRDVTAEIEQLRAALALASGGDTARDTVRRLLTKASDNAKRADRYRTAWRNARGRAIRARAEIDMWKRQLTLAEESRDRAVRDLYDADALTDHLCDANAALGREARIVRTWTDGVERRNSQLRGELRTALARAAELETAHAARRHLDHFDIHHNGGPRLPLPARGWAWWCHTCGDAALGLPDRATAEAHAIDHHEAMHAAAPAGAEEPQT